MSSRTPTECVDLATDESAADSARTDAIRALKRANECDELERLVRRDDLSEVYRREALNALATPQCDSTLRELVEEDPLEGPLHEEAAALLSELEGE